MSGSNKVKNILFWLPLVVGGIAAGLAGIGTLFFYGPGRGLMNILSGLLLQFLPSMVSAMALGFIWR